MLIHMDPNTQQQGNTTPPIYGQPTQPLIHESPKTSSTKSPYDFILETNRKPKHNPFKGGSLRSKLLLVVSVGAVIILAIVITSTVLNSSSKANTAGLISLAAEQQEILRVASAGISGSSDPALNVFSELTKLTVTSQHTKLIAYLKERKAIYTAIDLASALNKQTDQAFKAASTNGRYDEVVRSTLKAELTKYLQNLQTRYDKADGPIGKTLLADSYKSTKILLK
jgi:hypothetical protein